MSHRRDASCVFGTLAACSGVCFPVPGVCEGVPALGAAVPGALPSLLGAAGAAVGGGSVSPFQAPALGTSPPTFLGGILSSSSESVNLLESKSALPHLISGNWSEPIT